METPRTWYAPVTSLLTEGASILIETTSVRNSVWCKMWVTRMLLGIILWGAAVATPAMGQGDGPADTTHGSGAGQIAVYGELLGPGLGLSLNVDRVYKATPQSRTSLRVGLGKFPYVLIYSAPVMISRIYRGGGELGAGIVPVLLRDPDEANVFVPTVAVLGGYRKQSIDGGVVFRINLSLLIGYAPAGIRLLPLPGLSLGFAGQSPQ